jgi:polyphosphate kinase
VYYFHNGGDEEVLIGSADLMERNLDRRIEILSPVLDCELAHALKERLLDFQLADTVRATTLGGDGTYLTRSGNGARPLDTQAAWAAGGLSLMA